MMILLSKSTFENIILIFVVLLAAGLLIAVIGCGSSKSSVVHLDPGKYIKNDILGWAFIKSAVWDDEEDNIMISYFKEPTYGWGGLVVSVSGMVPLVMVKKTRTTCFMNGQVEYHPNGPLIVGKLYRTEDCTEYDDMMGTLNKLIYRKDQMDRGILWL